MSDPDTRRLCDVFCPVCEGKPHSLIGTCPACHGVGYFTLYEGDDLPSVTELLTCTACNGAGNFQELTCVRCKGEKRIRVHYVEETYVRYHPTPLGPGTDQHCDKGYTWLMAPCHACCPAGLTEKPSAPTMQSDCDVCLGTTWIPSDIADAIERFLRPLPPGMPHEQVAHYIRCNLDQIALLIPHGVPSRRIA